MASTLTIWKTILLVGVIIMGVFGHNNVYIPEDQKEKALRSAELKAFEDEACKVITYEIRFDRIWYVVLATIISALTVVFLVLEDFRLLSAMVGNGTAGIIFGITVAIAVSIVTEAGLLFVCINCEYYSLKETKRQYFREFGVVVVAKD